MASGKGGAGCLILFGLVFLVAGLAPGAWAVHGLWRAAAMARWQQAEAEIIAVDLRSGDEGTRSVACTYRYRAPDPAALEAGTLRTWECERVGIVGGNDNVGSWQEDTWRRLDAAFRAGRTVPCWYDPRDPADAVLDRGVRWGLTAFMFVFLLVFGGVGGGVIVLGLRQRRTAAVAAMPAEGGWRSRRDWAAGRIPASAATLWVAVVAALVCNGLAWTAVVAILRTPQRMPPAAFVPLFALFPLLGLALAWLAGLSVLRRLRHGVPELRLTEVPLRTGTRVEAAVRVRSRPQEGDRPAATLAVVRRIETKDGDGASSRDHTIWSMTFACAAPVPTEDGGWSWPLAFAIPADMPPWEPGGDITWRLSWNLARRGLDIAAGFELPVLQGVDDPELRGADLKLAADRSDRLAVLRRAGIAVGDGDGAVMIDLSRWRNPVVHASGLGACAALTCGAAAAAMAWGAWAGIPCLLILPLAWRGALRSALYRSAIRIAPGSVTVEAGWWRLRRIEVSDATGVERRSHMSAGDTSYHDFWLRRGDGTRVACARGVPGEAAARLAEVLQAAIEA